MCCRARVSEYLFSCYSLSDPVCLLSFLSRLPLSLPLLRATRCWFWTIAFFQRMDNSTLLRLYLKVLKKLKHVSCISACVYLYSSCV